MTSWNTRPCVRSWNRRQASHKAPCKVHIALTIVQPETFIASAIKMWWKNLFRCQRSACLIKHAA
jgi:hypothetical protein